MADRGRVILFMTIEENERLTFTLVTDGVASATERAKAAAGDKHVAVIGGTSTAQHA